MANVVWLLWDGDYEPSLEGVFASEEAAQRRIKRMIRERVANAVEADLVGPDEVYASKAEARRRITADHEIRISREEVRRG